MTASIARGGFSIVDKIKEVKALQVLDSRGCPTIKVTIITEKSSGWSIVPSGMSKGSYEAVELRDKKRAYSGKSVENAVSTINKVIAKKIKGMIVTDQKAIDNALASLDSTPNKSKIGGNAMIGVSLAVCRAAANSQKKELYEYIGSLFGNTKFEIPVPQANFISGGKHSNNRLKIQECLLIPNKASSFSEAARIISETYQELKKIIDEKYGFQATNVTDEGSFSPSLKSAEEALQLITLAVQKSGYKRKICLGLDVAVSTTFLENDYDLGVPFSPEELMAYYKRLSEKYDAKSIEDGFDENDSKSWSNFMQQSGKNIQIAGDNLLASNEKRVLFASENKLCNAIVIKPDHVGTLTEALAAASKAKKLGWQIIVSHRSGDSEDSFIADLAVGIGASQIKIGAPCRSERTAKYNRLLEIEAKIKKYAGKKLKL